MDLERARQLSGVYLEYRNDLDVFGGAVKQWFSGNQRLNSSGAIHSIKYRLKDPGHLVQKLLRKFPDSVDFPDDDLFRNVTDLAGVRVLHLHQAQFCEIHQAVLSRVEGGDWVFGEPPKAFTWDPESQEFFKAQGLTVELRDTFYTSVHYLVKPREDSRWCCEVQVRTLFEEIWGEVDHSLNYPEKIEKVEAREQLRVLSKLVGAGSRLLDSIYRSV